LLVPCVSHLIAIAPSLALPELLLYAGVIVASTLSLGALLEGRPWAQRAEQARALGLGLAFALLPQWFGYVAPMILKVTILVVMVIAVVWLDKNIKTFQWRTT